MNDNRTETATIAVGPWVKRGYGSMSTLVPLVRALNRPSHREEDHPAQSQHDTEPV